MAEKAKKKVTGERNKDRRNGKAWKEGQPPEKRKPKAVTKTVERQQRDAEIRRQREIKREARIAQRAAERTAREEAEIQRQAEERRQEEEANRLLREEASRLEGLSRVTGKKIVKAPAKKRAPKVVKK
jgi:colicin import membrane protein